MDKLVLLPLFYYKIVRLVMCCVLYSVLCSLAQGFYVGIIGVPITYCTIGYVATSGVIFVDLYFAVRYLWQLKNMGDKMLAEQRQP